MPPTPPRRRRARSLWRRLELLAALMLRRLARYVPAWVRSVAPLASSLAGHALILFVLALLLGTIREEGDREAELQGQLRDDLTTLKPDDRTGDPFTTLDAIEPPSLPLEMADSEQLNTPAVTPEVRLADQVDLTPGESAANAGLSARGRAPSDPGGPSVPFTGRRGEMRARLVRREGGTVESEAAVERGLDWIARHQRPDGGWSLDTNPMCTPPGCPPRGAMQSDTAATGLALLPLLGAGHTHLEPGRYRTTISRGLAWLLDAQAPDGSIFTGGGGNTGMYSHAIATMAICEAYALTKDKRLSRPARRAVMFLARSQHVLGGWRYRPMSEGDTSVFGWAIFALRSADLGGVPVPRRTIKQAVNYLNRAAADKIGASYAYQPGRGATMTMTAEGLVARQILGWRREVPALLQGVQAVSDDLEASQSRNIYYWYYATQLLHNMKDKNWERWNARVRDGLVGMQVRGDGCDAGSWDPENPQPDQWGQSAGRLYTTSLSILTLEVYYRYLPLYQDRGGELVGSDEDKIEADDAEAPGR